MEASWKAMEEIEKSNPDLRGFSDVKEEPICMSKTGATNITDVKFK